MLKIGDKVICIDDNYNTAGRIMNIIAHGWKFPQKGQVYTVRKIFNGQSIAVEEIINKEDKLLKREPGFYYWHFKKISSIQTEEIKCEEEKEVEEEEIEDPYMKFGKYFRWKR